MAGCLFSIAVFSIVHSPCPKEIQKRPIDNSFFQPPWISASWFLGLKKWSTKWWTWVLTSLNLINSSYMTSYIFGSSPWFRCQESAKSQLRRGERRPVGINLPWFGLATAATWLFSWFRSVDICAVSVVSVPVDISWPPKILGDLPVSQRIPSDTVVEQCIEND